MIHTSYYDKDKKLTIYESLTAYVDKGLKDGSLPKDVLINDIDGLISTLILDNPKAIDFIIDKIEYQLKRIKSLEL